MSESTTTPQGGNTVDDTGSTTPDAKPAEQDAKGGENHPAGGSREFTQEEFNSLLAREKRELRAKFADYDDLKAKAAKLDELEEAKKSELEKANDATAKAQDEAKSWQAKYDELKAEVERREAIDKAAAAYKVDAAMLARMTGDVDENAKFLAEQDASRPKYPEVRDGGEGQAQGPTLDEIRAIKDPAERVRARAEYLANHSTR